MTEHIVALFETKSAAAAAERDLEGAGIPPSLMRRYTPAETETPEPGSSVAGTTETSEPSGGGFWAWLWGEDADTASTQSAHAADGAVYDRRARDGNTILSVMVHDDSLIHQAVTILDAHHPLEIDEQTFETEPTSRTSGSIAGQEAAGKTSVSPSGMDYSTSAVATPAAGMTPSSAAPVTQKSDPLPARLPNVGRVSPVATPGDDGILLAEDPLKAGNRTGDRGPSRVRRYVI